MSDGFYSDDDKEAVDTGPGGLMPILEVPSDVTGSQISTSRTDASSNADETPRSESADYSDDYEEDEDLEEAESAESEKQEEETPRTGRSSRSGKKHKTKKKKGALDMTPPDKILRRAEKKIKYYTDRKKAEKAMKELIRCTALSRIVYGDDSWKHARSYVNLAQGYLELKNYAIQAEYHSENAKNLMFGKVQTSSNSTDKASILETMLNLYYILGKAQMMLKKLKQSEQSLTEAEKLASERAKISTVTDDDVEAWEVKIYLAIARLRAKQEKHALSTEYYEKAKELLELRHGKESIELIPLYQSMGAVEQSKGKHADHERAIDYYLKAHSIANKRYEGTNIAIGDTAFTLGSAYASVGEFEAETSAESYFNEALVIYQSTHGPLHTKTIETENELARLMIRTERPDEAICMLKDSLERKHEVFGEYSSEVAETWKLIGSVHLSKSDSVKALKALTKCQSIQSLAFGPNSRKAKETQKTIDLLLSNPSLAAKQKNKADELKNRPKFNGIVNRGTQLGGYKPQNAY